MNSGGKGDTNIQSMATGPNLFISCPEILMAFLEIPSISLSVENHCGTPRNDSGGNSELWKLRQEGGVSVAEPAHACPCRTHVPGSIPQQTQHSMTASWLHLSSPGLQLAYQMGGGKQGLGFVLPWKRVHSSPGPQSSTPMYHRAPTAGCLTEASGSLPSIQIPRPRALKHSDSVGTRFARESVL